MIISVPGRDLFYSWYTICGYQGWASTALSEQLQKLLTDSNLDYLGLSETWLTPTTPSGIFNIPEYNVFRRDRTNGKGGGVLLYVKNNIQCKQMDLPNNALECVAVTISLSPEMSFNIIVLYRPPNEKDTFFDDLKEVLKICNGKEVLLMVLRK